MEKLTYKQAFDKITEAYIKDEIKPFEISFCFCGTLHGSKRWFLRERGSPYSYEEYIQMEKALLDKAYPETCTRYEERLFDGMCDALEVLKQIHKERGEDIDGIEPLQKRNLQKCQ